MYTRSNTSDSYKRDESGGAQSFRRGSYNIPASYAGNAFSSDFSPTEEELRANSPDLGDEGDCPQTEPCDSCKEECELAKIDVCSSSEAPPDVKREASCEGEKRRSLLGELFGKSEGGFELDDLILIGLILLLSRDGENNGDTLILLAFLLIIGF